MASACFGLHRHVCLKLQSHTRLHLEDARNLFHHNHLGWFIYDDLPAYVAPKADIRSLASSLQLNSFDHFIVAVSTNHVAALISED